MHLFGPHKTTLGSDQEVNWETLCINTYLVNAMNAENGLVY